MSSVHIDIHSAVSIRTERVVQGKESWRRIYVTDHEGRETTIVVYPRGDVAPEIETAPDRVRAETVA